MSRTIFAAGTSRTVAQHLAKVPAQYLANQAAQHLANQAAQHLADASKLRGEQPRADGLIGIRNGATFSALRLLDAIARAPVGRQSGVGDPLCTVTASQTALYHISGEHF